MDSFVEQPLAPTFSGFEIARVLFDIRNHARIEDHLFCYVLQCFQTIWKQDHIRFIDWSDWAWYEHIAILVRNGDDVLALLVFVPRVPNAIAPFFATVWVPSPCSTLVSRCFSAARCCTLAMNACHSDPSSAHVAKAL